ncbi:Fur family transcriptional regulator [Mesonia sp. K7]|uniref:Fur family transcriptional regulator n=1 Tax=Mesonia sp. K7 TaxID=2218606 RepID=UPI000DA75A92|nr:transcriptional repressor [Mesonia sp. K7]PZD76707.1 transcriptional repressor [Mesonia sp. K7]
MKRRTTSSKTEILEVLKSSGNAMSHEMIQTELHRKVDRATIYRVLNQFCEDGKVHKIVGDDGKQYFAFCMNCGEKKHVHSHKHLHFRCLECGKVECLESELSLPLPSGYIGKVHNLLVSGYCRECGSEEGNNFS